MSAVATDHAPLALPPAAPAPRRNVSLVGSVLAIVAGTALLGGLLAAYFGARQEVLEAGNEWVDTTTIPNVGAAVAYFTLLLCAFTVQWAVSAVKIDDRRQAYVAIGLTFLLAAAFINAMTFTWTQLAAGAGDGAFGDHMYAVTVTHTLLVIAAIVLLLVMGFRVVGGQFGPRNAEFVQSAAAFWHFVAAAGFVIWFCIWFLEGGPG